MAREDWLRVGEGTADEVPMGRIVMAGGIQSDGCGCRGTVVGE